MYTLSNHKKLFSWGSSKYLQGGEKKITFQTPISPINLIQINPANHRTNQPINQTNKTNVLSDIFLFSCCFPALSCSSTVLGAVVLDETVKLGGRTNTFITPRLCQTHMGSLLRTRGSSAPAAERRGPAARSGEALTPPGPFL